jgi:hypothetical protein
MASHEEDENKHAVGYRLANWALGETYKKKDLLIKARCSKAKLLQMIRSF